MAPNQKWNALFRQCLQSLGAPEPATPNGDLATDNAKLWQNVAVAISCSHKKAKPLSQGAELERSEDRLEVIPRFGQLTLDYADYGELKQYINNVSCSHKINLYWYLAYDEVRFKILLQKLYAEYGIQLRYNFPLKKSLKKL